MSSLTQPQKLRPPRTWKPNYNLLHANPLPLNIQSLPPLIPHNPISWLQILFTYLVCRTKCQPEPLYKAVFSPSTRSVHVTDSRSIQALWNSGFFGKGSLSRSEPTWISRRRRALGIIGKDEALTAEEITERRRRERREFKLERARAEKEKIQSLLAQEGKLNVPTDSTTATSQGDRSGIEDDMTKSITFAVETEPRNAPTIVEDEQNKTIVNVEDLEHLQLTLEEAFFLLYGLGVVNITMPTGTQEGDKKSIDAAEALFLFRRYSYFPPVENELELQPDDTFMLNYVVYHHFRSLGWVVRPGIKFAVDYLLYNRGPVFSHAEFGILIIPAYSHQYWKTNNSHKRRQEESKPWHWLHCVNRVSAQVKKTLILVYVEVPPPVKICEESVTEILKKYKVREVALRRWLVTRNRD
jgi:tRNA-splicing endonuclease subunit Sen2